MRAHHHIGADAPGLAAPEPALKDEARELGSDAGFRKQETADSADCARPGNAVHALRVIEGEAKAREYLARLQAEQADPDELALILAALYGPTLRGFCAVITKALPKGGPAC